MRLDTNSPYRGLTPYSELDAPYFFGRRSEIATIAASIDVARITLLYGPSGVGKSSVLRAGVMYTLNQRALSNFAESGRPEAIPVYFNRWQHYPLPDLIQSIADAARPFLSPTEPDFSYFSYRALTRQSQLSILLSRLSAWNTQTNSDFLLILDQFEEFFLYNTRDHGSEEVIDAILQIVNNPALRTNLLFSLREDSLARLDRFKGKIPFLFDNRLSITHLNYRAGYDAILQPLQKYNEEHSSNYSFEPTLIDTILDQVERGKVALTRQSASTAIVEQGQIEAPYLQLVLARLWQQALMDNTNELLLSTLNKLGGASAIVSNYITDTLDGSNNVQDDENKLTDNERDLIARFIDRLVTLGGTKIALTLNELSHYAQAESSSVQAVIQKLENKRLLRSVPSGLGDIQYEIFHDVLAQPLLDWQEHYQSIQREIQRLVDTRIANYEFGQRLLKVKSQFTLKEAGTTTENNKSKRARLSKLLLLFLTLISIVGSVTVGIGYYQRVIQTRISELDNQAQVEFEKARIDAEALVKAEVDFQKRRIHASELAAQATFLLDNSKDLSLPLILASYAVNTTLISDNYVLANADLVLREAIAAAKPITQKQVSQMIGHTDWVWTASFSSDGKLIVSASNDKSIRVWDVASGQQVQQMTGHADRVLSAFFNADGKQIVSASADKTIRIWNVASGQQVRQLVGHVGEVRYAAFSPNGQQIVSASDDRTVSIWDAATGQQLGQVVGYKSKVQMIAFSPDGNQLAIVSDDHSVGIWDMINQKEVKSLMSHTYNILSATFSPDGKQIVIACDDQIIRIWSAGYPGGDTNPRNIPTGYIGLTYATYSPDGKQIVSTGEDGIVRIWDVVNRKEMRQLVGHTDGVLFAAYSPDGKQIVSASKDGTMRIWEVSIEELLAQARKLIPRNPPILTSEEQRRYRIE